jgi:hypothetical protein
LSSLTVLIAIISEDLKEFTSGSGWRKETWWTRLPISRNCLSLFDNDDITCDDLTSWDFLFLTTTDDLVRIDALTKVWHDHK